MTLAEFRALTADLPDDTPILTTAGEDTLSEAALITWTDLHPDDDLLPLLNGNEIIITEEAR